MNKIQNINNLMNKISGKHCQPIDVAFVNDQVVNVIYRWNISLTKAYRTRRTFLFNKRYTLNTIEKSARYYIIY